MIFGKNGVFSIEKTDFFSIRKNKFAIDLVYYIHRVDKGLILILESQDEK